MTHSLGNIVSVPTLLAIADLPEIKRQIFSTTRSILEDNTLVQWIWNETLKDLTYKNLEYNFPLMESNIPKVEIKFVGIEMLKWAENLQTHFDIPLKFSQEFIKSSFFTSKGFIDEEKGAREIIKEPTLSVFLKYKISCHYFLKDDILNLYQELRNIEPDFKKIFSKMTTKTPIVMWSEYLDEITTSVQIYPSVNQKFFEEVFSYGMENKNVAAVKFSLGLKGISGENETELKGERKLIYKSFSKCMSWVETYLKEKDIYQTLLSKDFVAHYNLIQYFISVMTKEELKDILIKEDLTFIALQCFLYWPYQYQFMDIAQLVFENLNKVHYKTLMDQIIIIFIHKENISSSYSYRLLLREFWIQSPFHLKNYIIKYESGLYLTTPNEIPPNYFLIERLFRITNFEIDDDKNIYLILKEASPTDKKKIFQIQGKLICGHLCSIGKFEMANYFFHCLGLEEETSLKFKNDSALDFFVRILKRKSLEFINDEFFKWVAGTDKIDELKDKIFNELTSTNNIEYMFLELQEDTLPFLNKILKLFLKTDDKIEEWKKNILRTYAAYSPCISYEKRDWFDQLLIYLGYSEEQASYKKKESLSSRLLEIAKAFLYIRFPAIDKVFINRMPNEEEIIENIIYLCSYEKQRILWFMDALRSVYVDSTGQSFCWLCMNNNLVSFDKILERIGCEQHEIKGFLTFYNINVICSSLSKRINELLKLYEVE
ncbi:UNVERIFIED_CONTAM: hypothetical protein RMT77_019851 [Armadillidium vulgare]